MPKPWEAREVAIVLPMSEARAMLDRAGRFDVDRGGRFDARGASIILWQGSDEVADAEPCGTLYFRFHTPTEATATIWRLEWDPAVGGSEAEVLRAVEVLRGGG